MKLDLWSDKGFLEVQKKRDFVGDQDKCYIP